MTKISGVEGFVKDGEKWLEMVKKSFGAMGIEPKTL
jgi:hypothetical protein